MTVSPFYLEEHSNPPEDKYLHGYQITIENLGRKTVKLLFRHWYIFDSNLQYKEVKGEGVIGKQPTLAPGESYTYNSWCPLETTFGSMHGSFTFADISNGIHIKVDIPRFLLIPAFQLT